MNERTTWQEAGVWLRGLRMDAEITQRELAEQVGAPDTYWIEEIEAGRRAVPVAFFTAFARTFGVPVDVFVARCAAVYGSGNRVFGEAA